MMLWFTMIPLMVLAVAIAAGPLLYLTRRQATVSIPAVAPRRPVPTRVVSRAEVFAMTRPHGPRPAVTTLRRAA